MSSRHCRVKGLLSDLRFWQLWHVCSTCRMPSNTTLLIHRDPGRVRNPCEMRFCDVVISISPLLRRTSTLTNRHQCDTATVADGDVHTGQLGCAALVACNTSVSSPPLTQAMMIKRLFQFSQVLIGLTCKAAVLMIPYPVLLVSQKSVSTASHVKYCVTVVAAVEGFRTS